MSVDIKPYRVDVSEVQHKVDSVTSKIQRLCDVANDIEVEDIIGLNQALEAIESLSTLTNTLEEIIEPFRKSAYDHYKSILASKKELVAVPQETISLLRDRIKRFNDRIELLKAEEQKRLAASAPTADAIVEAERPVVTQDVEGLGWREYWRADLAEPESESLRALCAAIAKGEAPVSLVTLNKAEADRLAKSLKDMMRFPGLRIRKEKVPVIRRR